ncbi:AraC family transcriptional regulator [Tengunoibacter tsumagoiensis]|uniref:HTH araC/xylS-type domain-containing protein n=1 Tax=Tengunoibacter tsumagoiensis TaxID=2014871 RepID=A0A402A185_9CHLR|nr:AraC family transcriptional regulator [Tengunoibacter tsumagoiensis]GCE12907.1 hypothetical protein KTT_27660 [Tengunoibacter tsumagoiensis]
MEDGFWPEQVQINEIVYPPKGTLGPRIQPNLQLVLVHRGHLTLTLNGQQHFIPDTTIFVLFPGGKEYFAFAEEQETHHSWLHITSSIPEKILQRLQRLEWPLPLSSTMLQLMQQALAIRPHVFSTREEILKTLALQMLWRYIGEGEARLTQTRQQHPAVEHAQQYILMHLSEDLTLEKIADVVAMSPAHLIRLFQAQLQTTPMAYVWQQRVQLGIRLLEQTGLTVGTIAERCGFQSRFHFSRRIRQVSGATPLTIRQRSWQHLQREDLL